MSTLKVWDLNDAAQHDSAALLVPCSSDGDSVTVPAPGAFLNVRNKRRRDVDIRIGYTTVTVRRRSRIMIGPFRQHDGKAADPVYSVRYPDGAKGLSAFACAQLTAPRRVVEEERGYWAAPGLTLPGSGDGLNTLRVLHWSAPNVRIV